MILKGKWEEVEKCVFEFIKVEDINHSFKIYFEIRKQRYLEALDSNNNSKALDSVMKDLKLSGSRNA
jgi:hypothetical protein